MRYLLFLMIGLAVLAAAPAEAAGKRHMKLYSVEGTFADVQQDAVDAIVNGGFVIDITANIGEMLARTGKDIGATKKIYENAVMMQFCSAKYSREAMEADPTNISFCPYVIFVYNTPDKPGTVNVGYRRPGMVGSLESRRALLSIEAMLDGIAREATGN